MTEKFDVKAVANEIKSHLVVIDRDEASLILHKRRAAELLQDVALNHPNELKECCKLAGLQPSRTKELMQIALDKKTQQQIKDATKKRVADHRAKKKAQKAAALPPPKPGPLHPPVTATGEAKAEHAEAEDKVHVPPAKKVSPSEQAMNELRWAIEHWMPKIKRAARMSVWEYAREIGEKLNAADDAKLATKEAA